MNDLTLSGIISSSFEEFGQDGISFPVLVSQGSSNTTVSDQFTCVAFGQSAAFIRNRASSGSRIVIQGRLGAERFGGEKYHSAITVGRVLAISESEAGTDFSNIVVSGDAEIQELKYVGDKGTALVPIRLTNLRHFTNKEGEVQTYKTFVGASVWSERAEALEPQTNRNMPVVLQGGLRARGYEDKDGDQIEKIDVWVQEVFADGVSDAPPPPRRGSTNERQSTSSPKKKADTRRRTASLDDDPF